MLSGVAKTRKSEAEKRFTNQRNQRQSPLLELRHCVNIRYLGVAPLKEVGNHCGRFEEDVTEWRCFCKNYAG